MVVSREIRGASKFHRDGGLSHGVVDVGVVDRDELVGDDLDDLLSGCAPHEGGDGVQLGRSVATAVTSHSRVDVKVLLGVSCRKGKGQAYQLILTCDSSQPVFMICDFHCIQYC